MAGSQRTEEAAPAAAPAATGATATAPAADAATRAAQVASAGHTELSSGASAASLDDLKGFEFECLKNASYHSAREGFLDDLHRWFMFWIILFGAGALLDLLPKDIVVTIWGHTLVHLPTKETFAALTTILAAMDLTFDLSNRARVHGLMKRRYFELLSDLVSKKTELLEGNACLNRFSADEEPAYHALLGHSWNAAQKMVYGDEADRLDIPWWHLFLKHLWRFDGTEYDKLPK